MSGHATPAARLLELATARGFRIAVAESLTGGLLAAALVDVPGASRAFSGGVVAYDTRLKHTLLDVDDELLRRVGPVDESVARAMARGVRSRCAVRPVGASRPDPADIGIATTGVAGPEPDPHSGQPPGTVWVAVSAPTGDHALLLPRRVGAERLEVREYAVHAAIELAITVLGAS